MWFCVMVAYGYFLRKQEEGLQFLEFFRNLKRDIGIYKDLCLGIGIKDRKCRNTRGNTLTELIEIPARLDDLAFKCDCGNTLWLVYASGEARCQACENDLDLRELFCEVHG